MTDTIQVICLFVAVHAGGNAVPVEIFPNSAIGRDSCAGALLEMTNAIRTGTPDIRCRVCELVGKADVDVDG